MYFLFVFCICLFNPIQAFSVFIDKRQAIASRSCLNEANSVSICSPTPSSVWYNDTVYDITWKYNNPIFIPYDNLDLHLLLLDNGVYQSVKNWTGLAKTVGVLVPRVDDTWFPSLLPENSPNVSRTMYFFIVGAGVDIQEDLEKMPSSQSQFKPPVSFTLIQNAHNTTTTPSPSHTVGPTNNRSDPSTLAQSNSQGHNNSLPNWAIAVICIVSVLFLAAFAALWIAIKRYKNKKQAELVTEHNDEKLLVPEETTPVQQRAVPLGLNTEANQSSSILSSTDALMIADTFRQFMRKPEWTEQHDLK
ncbi:hypothetical protein BY458DRAFT_530358 [Sporodiniella umbellata]|nr:hypothetical protein BY458DRAFT_530358 [Sporodiniella umbellata]